jgi:hypothetical protein
MKIPQRLRGGLCSNQRVHLTRPTAPERAPPRPTPVDRAPPRPQISPYSAAEAQEPEGVAKMCSTAQARNLERAGGPQSRETKPPSVVALVEECDRRRDNQRRERHGGAKQKDRYRLSDISRSGNKLSYSQGIRDK